MPQVDYIECGSGGDGVTVGGLTDADWHNDQQWTAALFFYDAAWDTGSKAPMGLCKNDAGTDQHAQFVLRDGGTDELDLYQDLFTSLGAGTAQVSDATWYSVVVSCNGSSALKSRLYSESGSFLEELSGTRTTANRTALQFTFGCYYNNNTNAYLAAVDRIALISAWKDTELSTAQQNSWAADPLNFSPLPEYIRLYDANGGIEKIATAYTNNGSGSNGAEQGGAPVFTGAGPDVPALSTSVAVPVYKKPSVVRRRSRIFH